ncbi:MAG: cyclase family protein [Acidibacillus sp.]|nr:cyclase family protein [Acidibacillus sp.]
MGAIIDGVELIDLSVLVSESLPSYWPSHMPFSSKVWNYYIELNEKLGFIQSQAPYQTRFWIIDEHCGTHFDAPTHFIPPIESGLPWANKMGAQTGDKVPLEDLIGDAVCIDVTSLVNQFVSPGESPWITIETISDWEQEHGSINSSVVLFRTGWDKFYVKGESSKKYMSDPLITRTGPGWPAPNAETIILLYDKGVRCIGIDAPSIGASHDGGPAHHAGLSRGMRYVEMLTSLDKLPEKNFSFMFLPVKVAGSTGGPGRAVAFVKIKSK